MQALRGLAILLLLQATGETLSKAFHWPVPGPVVGLLMLAVGLQWAPLRAPVAAAARLLLAHLSLLFVPVSVGVITYLSVLARYGWQLAVAIVLSTWIGLAVTALVLRALWKEEGRHDG